MARAYILGDGGHARVIAAMLAPGAILVGRDQEAALFADLPADGEFYLGVGDNATRKRLMAQVLAAGGRLPPCVAPFAFVARDAEIGDGAVICPGSVVGARARIGLGAIINTLSSVDHDCRLGDFGQVTAGVTFGGGVIAGQETFFGIKSAVVPGRTIGDHAVVMAGSLVTADVPEKVIVGGIPARLVRAL